MAWLRTSTSTWQNRMDVAVDGSSRAAGSVDVKFSIGPAQACFWGNVQDDLYDVIITDADGLTLLGWQFTSLDLAAKTVQIEVDNYDQIAANVTGRLYIYWNTLAEVVVDPQTPFTLTTELDAYVTSEEPAQVLTVQRPAPGRTIPQLAALKSAAEELAVWIDPRQLMRSLAGKCDLNGSRLYEEIAYTSIAIEEAGTPNAGMVDATKTRAQSGMVRVTMKAGTSGTDYTAVLTIGTTSPDERATNGVGALRIIEQRILLQVQDLQEA